MFADVTNRTLIFSVTVIDHRVIYYWVSSDSFPINQMRWCHVVYWSKQTNLLLFVLVCPQVTLTWTWYMSLSQIHRFRCNQPLGVRPGLSAPRPLQNNADVPVRSVSRSNPSSLSDAKAPKSRGIRFSSRSGGGRDENKPSRAELVPSCSNVKLPELNTLTSCRGFHIKSVVVEPPW